MSWNAPSCFVCGQTLSMGHTVSVSASPGATTSGVAGAVVRFHRSCAPRLASEVLKTLDAPAGRTSSRTVTAGADAMLTPREAQVLRRIAAGDTNRQIAANLGLTPKHVKNRVSVILSKLEASSRTEAAVLAIRLGIVEE